MAFNHYAKMRRILAGHPNWVIHRIPKPTSAQKFNGEVAHFDHYYRVYDAAGRAIKFCKFQQIDRFARAMQISVEQLPLINE
jgi:hypothetical protein